PRGHGVEDGRDGEAPRDKVPTDRLPHRGAQHSDGPLRRVPRGPRLPRVSMYGVVVVPRGKRAKGVNLKQKTTTCSCGFEIRVVPARVRGRAETARELVPLVGQVSAEMAGGTEAYRRAQAPIRRKRSREVHVRVIGIAAKARNRAGRVVAEIAAYGSPI